MHIVCAGCSIQFNYIFVFRIINCMLYFAFFSAIMGITDSKQGSSWLLTFFLALALDLQVHGGEAQLVALLSGQLPGVVLQGVPHTEASAHGGHLPVELFSCDLVVKAQPAELDLHTKRKTTGRAVTDKWEGRDICLYYLHWGWGNRKYFCAFCTSAWLADIKGKSSVLDYMASWCFSLKLKSEHLNFDPTLLIINHHYLTGTCEWYLR